jgi:hypothetical protein
MDRVDSGSKVVDFHGGLWTKSRWSNEERKFLEWTDRQIRAERRLWKGDIKTAPFNRLRFVITADKDANAFAHYAYGWHTIGLHAGLVLQVWEAIERLSISKSWVQQIGEIEPLLFILDRYAFKADADWKSCLAMYAFRWTFYHEVAHCIAGHCLLLPEGIPRTLYEAGSRQSDFERDVARFLEIDADAHAAIATLSFRDEALESQVTKLQVGTLRVAQIGFALGLVSLLLDRKQASFDDHIESSHPHPFVRVLTAMEMGAGTAKREFGMPIEGVSKMSHRTVHALAATAKTLGYTSATWQLSSAAAFQRALDHQDADIQLYEKLKSQILGELSSLRDAQWAGRARQRRGKNEDRKED